MITRSRRAALNSSTKSTSSNTSFNSPSTSKHHNNLNNNSNKTSIGFVKNSNINGDDYNDDDDGLNVNLRRSSRRLTDITVDNFTGSVQQSSAQQQQQSQLLNGNTIENIVKDVIGGIVDYVSKPGLKELVSTKTITTNHSSTTTSFVNTQQATKSTDSNFLHCNESSVFSQNQPSSSYPSSPTTINYTANDDGHEFNEESDTSRIEAITCEVSFDVDMSEDDCGQCPVCGLYGRLEFEGYLEERVGKVCSKHCVDKLRIIGKACICAGCDKRIPSDSQGYLANFGLERSTLCSEECLLKFEKENEPAQKCYCCKKDILLKEDPAIFYWQTMEFCSPECIENLQQSWGKKCANCDAPVPQQSLGKYSVRFGNVIKQFCHGSCLEQYKKAVKVCAYCQVNLSGCKATCTSVTGGSSTKRIREFCDPICRSHYLQMVSLRNSSTSTLGNGEGAFSSPAVQCCQCSRIVEKSSCLDVIFRGRKFLICSTFCLSAFKFSFDVTKIICESCSKYGWSSRSANILHYSGFTKLFCSRKCLQMHVLKIRRIQSCLTCNVKKYNFDLVEKYDCTSGDSKLFCSTYCYAAFEHFESQNAGKELKSFCDWCRKLARLPFHIPSPEKTVKNFCTYSCVLASQQLETNSGQFGFDKTTQPTIDSTFKQPGSSSFNYRKSPANPTNNYDDGSLPTSSYVSDLMRSTGLSTTPQVPPSPSSSAISPLPFRSSSFSSSSPFASPFSTTINDFQRSYPTTRLRSSTHQQPEASDSIELSSTRSTTHHDHNLNTKSTVPYPFFNSNYHCKKDETHCSTDSLPPTTANQNNYKNLGHPSSYSLDSSTMESNVADKSTMWQPSRRSKATLCRPIRRDRHTQTDILSSTRPPSPSSSHSLKTETTSDECKKVNSDHDDAPTTKCKTETTPDNRPFKYIPVPIFVPFFVPVPIPVPVGLASLVPLPLPTPIPFGFPIDSRLTPSKSTELIPFTNDESDNQPKDDVKQQQSTPSATPSTAAPTTTLETPKTTNSKDLDREKKPKSADELQTRSDNLDEITVNSDNLSSECQHSNTTTSTTTSESKDVKPVKRNAQDYDRNNLKQQDTLSTNSNNNNDNYCDDSDTCSNTSSSDDREKTKRRRVTIPTHG